MDLENADLISRFLGKVKQSFKTLKQIRIRRPRSNPLRIPVPAQDVDKTIYSDRPENVRRPRFEIPPSTAAVNRLPYEILREIVKQTLVQFPMNFSYMPWEASCISSPPIRASQVCHSWRVSFQSDSSLWTDLTIPYMKPGQIEAMLRLSGSAQLKVIITPSWNVLEPRPHRRSASSWCPSLTSTLPCVFREMHRIEVLKINIYSTKLDEEMFRLILSYLGHPAPALQRFYLEMRDWGRRWSDTLSPVFELESRNLIQTLFSGDAPNLKHIFQPVFTFEELLPSPMFHNLSGLHLALMPNTIISRHDILLDFLQLSPCLRILDIAITSSGPIFFPMYEDRVVHLSCLEHLLLRGSGCVLNTISFILKHITGPFQDVRFLMNCEDFPYTEPDSALLRRFLAQRRLPLEYLHIYEMSITKSLLLEFKENEWPFNNFGSQKNLCSEFSICYDIHQEPAERLPSLLRIPFDMSNIRILDIKIHRLDSIILRDLFLSMVHLKSLRVDGGPHNLLKEHMSVAYLTALMPLHFQPARTSRGDSRQDLPIEYSAPLSHIETRQDALARRGVFRKHGVYTECPCPTLRSIRVGTRCGNLKLDERYATMLELCSQQRRKAGFPLTTVSILSTELTLKSEVTAILRPCRGFPVKILTSRTIIDGQVVHNSRNLCLQDFTSFTTQ